MFYNLYENSVHRHSVRYVMFKIKCRVRLSISFNFIVNGLSALMVACLVAASQSHLSEVRSHMASKLLESLSDKRA